MATISPNAVLYSAVEMPCASMAGLLPPIAWPMSPGPACEPKISIIPITVPSRPSKGAAEAMVARAGRDFSSRCATARPVPCMAARSSVSLHAGLLLRARRPLASTSPRAEFWASWFTTSGGGRALTGRGTGGGGQALARGQIWGGVVPPMGGGQGLERDGDGFIEQSGGGDAGCLQGHEAFKNQCQSQDGTRNQGPDGPACSLYDGQQISLPHR